jgi:hypothetical protein
VKKATQKAPAMAAMTMKVTPNSDIAGLIVLRFSLAAAAYPVQNGPDVPAGRIIRGGQVGP